MSTFRNVYFFDSQAALDEALKCNRVPTNNPRIDGLQICYYDGQKLDNAPENCVNVPIDIFYDYFLTTKNRLPEFISFINKDFSPEMKTELINVIQSTLSSITHERQRLASFMISEAKSMKPDFSQGLRFFLIASRETTVMQYVSRNIADALKQLGCEVFLSIEENEMQKLDSLIHLSDYLNFKPNVTISINHLNNIHLHDDVFNFIWFQDPMPIIMSEENLYLRQRDYIYSLIRYFHEKLNEKGVDNQIQPFCINTGIYKTRNDIVRENKVVFIGSAYNERLNNAKVVDQLTKIYVEHGEVNENQLRNIAKKANETYEDILHTYGAVQRIVPIIKLCENPGNLKVELYGWGWDRHDATKPYFKGVLSYGEEVSKVYNSARYALVTGGYIMQQRTLEAAASGAIPVVYSNLTMNQDLDYDYHESILLFKTIEEMMKILECEQMPTVNLQKIVNDHSYETFAKKMISIVQQELNSVQPN